MRLPEPPPLRVAVIGPDPLARGGLAAALSGQVEITADLPPEAALVPGGADVLVWDRGSGAAPAAARRIPTLALVSDADAARAALAEGATGALRRAALPRALAAALPAIREGLLVLDPTFHLVPEAPAPLREPLTAREREVLALLGEGLTNGRIARRLEISPHTAKFHVAAILAKLGAASRAGAVARAAQLGLI